ncbi:MAG: hypothetical protein M3139_08560 [Bacteroidota bacterium]|nr:hypothetical protein [Bacteroidota bacterium]
MKKFYFIFLLVILSHSSIFSQVTPVNSQAFFLDDSPIEVTLTTDVRNLRNGKSKPAYQAAHIVMKFSDTTTISEDIRLEPRGIYRRENCDMASLMLNFKNSAAPLLSPLKKLKLVGGCKNGSSYNQLLLKEYLVYKIQNILSNMTFRVRLLHITYNDSRQKMKPYTQYAFLMEDMNDLAARNNCREIKKKIFLTEETNRNQMTFVNLFQYMIGNTDWSIYKYHNIKMMLPKNDTLARPYVVPYDYDFSGLVDADYAIPAEGLGIESVTQRLYRGFSRSYNELQATIDFFNEKKESIFYLINHFDLCDSKCKKQMIAYLDDFYKIISNKRQVESIFIISARTE